MFWLGVQPQNLPFPWESVTATDTTCPWTPHMDLQNGMYIGQKVQVGCTNVTYRQTDRPCYKEICRNRRNRMYCRSNFNRKSVNNFLYKLVAVHFSEPSSIAQHQQQTQKHTLNDKAMNALYTGMRLTYCNMARNDK